MYQYKLIQGNHRERERERERKRKRERERGGGEGREADTIPFEYDLFRSNLIGKEQDLGKFRQYDIIYMYLIYLGQEEPNLNINEIH